ncbi:ATP-dependent RNA helicase RhlB [Trichinella spiralis]|uniref:ATP-dependent RNA helicase RhlB n=1 Tax=Trichinella spiralis TaxID=6334 RepID=A0ABR3K5N1_TRISP
MDISGKCLEPLHRDDYSHDELDPMFMTLRQPLRTVVHCSTVGRLRLANIDQSLLLNKLPPPPSTKRKSVPSRTDEGNVW